MGRKEKSMSPDIKVLSEKETEKVLNQLKNETMTLRSLDTQIPRDEELEKDEEYGLEDI